jgi:hypothetical protein
MGKRHSIIGRDGGKIDNPRKCFETALAQVTITGVTWHTLHYTFCSRLVMADVPLERVSKLAGRKTLSVTSRYAHLAPRKLREALERPVSPGASATGDSLLEALQRLARNGSLVDALQPSKTAGTVLVQNGTQIGYQGQSMVLGGEVETDVSH